MPSVSLLILQPTPFCNIACNYCYLPDRSSKARMSPETLEQVFSRLFASDWVGTELDVCWHAGEPLVLPIDYYRQAFDTIKRLTPDGKTVRYYFQTNAMMITDEWCAFFNQHGAKIGVSIDGPQEINDKNRLTRSGRSTYSETLAGLRCLRRNKVDFSVISVLGSASLGKAQEMHDFYVSEGITNVCFNIEEIEGPHRASSLSGADRESEFERFMREFWNISANSNGLNYVREFSQMLQRIVRPEEGSEVRNTLVEPFSTVSVDWQGNFSTFSPELLGQQSERYGNFIIGNFWNEGLEDSVRSDVFQRLSGDIAAGVELCRTSCAYFSVCGGGSPVNKLYENGTFASAETLYCRLTVKAIANIAMDVIEHTAAQEAEAESPLFPEQQAQDLYVLGAGVSFPEHLTVQTIEILRSCKRIFTNLTDAEADRLPPDIRAKCVSLWPLYRNKQPRLQNYQAVTQAVIDAAAVERPVAWLTPGNPRIFDSVSEALVQAGRLRGWKVYVAPAVSCLDTLTAEIGYDPAGGLMVHEATLLVAQDVPLVPSVAALLLQPCAFGTNVAHIDSPFADLDLTPLRDHLSRFYPPEHRCAFIRSATQAGGRHRIFWVQLRDLGSMSYDRIAGTTLFLPPAEWADAPPDAARSEREDSPPGRHATAAQPARTGAGLAAAPMARPHWLGQDGEAGASRIVVFPCGIGDDAERVEVTVGTVRPPVGRGLWSYDREAVLPANNWRPLDAHERRAIVARARPEHFGNAIGIVRLPPSLLEPFQALRDAAGEAMAPDEIAPLRSSAATKAAVDAVACHARQYFGARDAEPDGAESGDIAGGICVNPAGLPTVTTQPQTHMLIGLHLDDWYGFPLADRALAPNRICVNLGNEDRFFVFLNLPIDRLHAALERSGRKTRIDSGGTPIGRAFLSQFPDYPILRIRIRPGEAYIAPTENVLHDGSSIGMATLDVTLQIRGRFDLTAA